MNSAVSITSSVFVGAVVGALQADPSAFVSLATAKQAMMGALLAGLVAVVHFYQPSPAPTAQPQESAKAEAVQYAVSLSPEQLAQVAKLVSQALPAVAPVATKVAKDLEFLLPKV
jgi:hypothetical protein